MSNLITKDDGSPFATIESAKSKRTRMGEKGLDTNVVKVDGGFALENKPYEKPKKRIPLGRRSILGIDPGIKDPAYAHRVVTDKGGRINMFRDAGWEVVEKKSHIGDPQVGGDNQPGKIVAKTVGEGEVGYLMRIKKEFYEEDQQTKAENIHETEAGLKAEENKSGRYGKTGIGDKR